MRSTMSYQKFIFILSAVMLLNGQIAFSSNVTYDVGKYITVDISSPTPNQWVPIDYTIDCSATANDPDDICDQYGNKTGDLGDDVTSGNSASDYHMMWTAEKGSFPYSQYSTSCKWKAPAYGAIGPCKITCTADDFNRQGDTVGADDEPNHCDATVNVWQITASRNTSERVSGNDDIISSKYGGLQLGPVGPNDPSGTFGYFINAQYVFDITSGCPETENFDMKQVITSYNMYASVNDKKVSEETGVNKVDWTSSLYKDKDPRFPNEIGTNSYKIFMLDAPGLITSTLDDNNRIISDNDVFISNGATLMEYDNSFKFWATWNGEKVSNEETYRVHVKVQAENGHWSKVILE